MAQFEIKDIDNITINDDAERCTDPETLRPQARIQCYKDKKRELVILVSKNQEYYYTGYELTFDTGGGGGYPYLGGAKYKNIKDAVIFTLKNELQTRFGDLGECAKIALKEFKKPIQLSLF